MVLHHPRQGAFAAVFLVMGLTAQTPGKFDPKSLSLPVSTASAARILATPQSNPPPNRLTEAQYATLKPHLASLLKQTEGSLAPRSLPSPNLTTLGATVNVTLGQTPPAGFRWQTGATIGNWPGGCSGGTGGGFVTFIADNVPSGTYLMTVYLDTTAALVSGGVNEGAFTATVQGRMINVPCVKTTPPSIPLHIDLNFPAGGARIYSCDFMRIR